MSFYKYTVSMPDNGNDTFEVYKTIRGLNSVQVIEDWVYNEEAGEERPVTREYPVVSFVQVNKEEYYKATGQGDKPGEGWMPDEDYMD